MARRQYPPFIGLTLALLALAGFVGAAYADESGLHSWDKKITNASKRFKLLSDFNNEAVLDKETGLVWEQSPGDTVLSNLAARRHCANKVVGGRQGWRLPSFVELASLIDASQSDPALPAGHPFVNIQNSYYWSATLRAGIAQESWIVNFSNGTVDEEGDHNTDEYFVWCVRGPMNADQY